MTSLLLILGLLYLQLPDLGVALSEELTFLNAKQDLISLLYIVSECTADRRALIQ